MAVLPRTRNPVERLLIACMVAGFLAVLAAGVAVVHELRRASAHEYWVNHSLQVEAAVADARRLIEQTENVRRGYMLTGSELAVAAYGEASRGMYAAVDRITRLTGDNARQRAAIAELRGRLLPIVAEQRRTNALVAAGDGEAARARFAGQAGLRPFIALRRVLDRIQAEERHLLRARDAERAAGQRAFYVTLAIAGALVLLLGLLSLVTVLRYTRDLDRARAATEALNATLEEQVDARTADLSRANEEIQRFAYIVSHDLRSPLVNVMGFTAELSAAREPLAALVDRVEAEAPALLDDDARLAVREDLPEAIGFIRTSTAKMDRLINAILTLSRQGRRTLTPEPIDVAALTDGIVAAMQHVVDERGVTVVVERPMPPLVADRLGVEQILSNLIENATKYLQPGRPGRIVVSAARTGGRVVVAVADNGRGIDPRDHQRVFDLFRRSGTQDQPGEGIGLAHVRALAYRMGGTVTVQSVLGEGATFRLSLPAISQQDHS